MPKYQLEEVSLELSNRCLGRCKHCSSDSRDDVDLSEEISIDEWREVIRQAHNLGAKVISLSGGEPLLYPYWRDIVAYVTRLGMGVLFYTCGITNTRQTTRMGDPPLESDDFVLMEPMPEDVLLYMKGRFQLSWGKIIFSLEGADALVHDGIVGVKGSFNNTIAAIQKALELGIPVEVHFTPQKDNWVQIPSFLELSRKIGVQKVSFLRLVPQGRAKVNDLMYTPEEFLEIQKLLYGYDWEGEPAYRIGCPLSFGHLLGYIDQRPRCHAGKDVLLVRPTGDVHACAGWKECTSLVLGNVQCETLAWIWENSEIVNMLRRFHEQDSAEGECKSCPWKYCCGGGCPAQRVIYNQERLAGLSDSQFAPKENNWAQLTNGVDPMCPRHTGLLSSSEIRNYRSHLPGREQDKSGNIVK